MEQHIIDIPELVERTIELQPSLQGKEEDFRKFCKLFSKLIKIAEVGGRHRALGQARAEIQSLGGSPTSKSDVALRFACSVVVDIVAQGWDLTVDVDSVHLHAPNIDGNSHQTIKQRIRDGHLLERDAQLREPSVREFISKMERRRLGPKGWISIFSLMRDGQELADSLRDMSASNGHTLHESPISPYLQLVDANIKCKHTGFNLIDIWRYFRHTWVSTYKSLPGRSMMILIRDAAAEFHPVIGIAALGSSMAQQTQRDKWIGWDSEEFIQHLSLKPTMRMVRWVHASIERLVDGIYVRDFLVDKTIKKSDIKRPSKEAIKNLVIEAKAAAEKHRRFPDSSDHKRNGDATSVINWETQAESYLFRSKRAKTLAMLLNIRSALKEGGLRADTKANLKESLRLTSVKDAIRQLVRLVKAEHVGVDMMDIIICGAVAPYNALLGGKLVCLMLASPEVIKFYRRRYRKQPSIIASSMKGKPVVRDPNLVLLATTSLYGVGSSQYNRIKIKTEALGGKPGHKIEYIELGVSKGYGSYHFSQASIDYLETLLGRVGDGRKVNSIFGEGVNPLMRKLRDALDKVGFPSEKLLNHGNPRVVYGIPLAGNFREVLLGLSRLPNYYFGLSNAKKKSEHIAEFWKHRWLMKRIDRPGILEQVTSHRLSFPISHGARVPMPEEIVE